MKKETYNGWTNYATWRVHLELFDAYEPEESEEVNARYLEDLADEIVTGEADLFPAHTLCVSYARAFLLEVNFHEIAQYINDDQ